MKIKPASETIQPLQTGKSTAAPDQGPQDQFSAGVQGPLTDAEKLKVLEGFAKDGKLIGKKLLVLDKQIDPKEALQRLQDEQSLSIELTPGGQKHKITDAQTLQTLDTLQGQNLKQNIEGPTVSALREFDKGQDANDGLFQHKFAGLGATKKVDAFQAFNLLQPAQETTKHRLLVSAGIGAGVGAGLTLVGGLASLAFPHAAALLQNPLVDVGIGAAGIFGGAAIGAGTGYVSYQNEHPRTLEVRNGSDSALSIANTKDAVELQGWLKDQATHPFTADQQKQSLEYLDKNVGLFRKHLLSREKINAEQAQKALENGETVSVPSPLTNKYNDINSFRKLQEIDTVRGLGINPVLPREVGQSLKFLEKGKTGGDGLFKPGSFDITDRLDGFEALELLLRERRNVGVKLNGKEYLTTHLVNLQELNALEGDLKNTIMPDTEYEAIKYFEKGNLSQTGEGKSVDAYESLQLMKDGNRVQIPSNGRNAVVKSTTDMQELYSLEVTKKNTILPDQDYNALQFWQDKGNYRVGGDEKVRAYEALQQIQANGSEFEVKSANRWAPANSFQDMVDLAAFEAKDSGFPNSVPPPDQDRLEYFQTTTEAGGSNGFRVGSREGRAYEGYRELRDHKPFDVKAQGVWNQVGDSQSLHELDALLGRKVNDILPQNQYDLLHELGDRFPNEGLALNGAKRNSYQGLQAMKEGQNLTYDFHGGDFGEVLQISNPKLDSLTLTKTKLDNQKEYDKYRYEVPEFKDKIVKQDQKLPDLAGKNLQFGQTNLSTGQSHKSTGESHKSQGESDLSYGQSRLSSANSSMMFAQMMPMYNTVTKTRQVSDGNGGYRTETYTEQEFNYARQMAISSAQSDIDSANRKIREANDEIQRAQQEIQRAMQEISVAQGQIRDASQLQSQLGSYASLLDSITPATYTQVMDSASAQLSMMQQLSHINELAVNLTHQTQLIGNMKNRPERPPGWQAPEPRVMD